MQMEDTLMRFGSFSEMLRHFSGNAPDSAAVIRPGADGPYTVTWREFCADIENRRDVLISSGKTCLGLLCDGSYEAVVEIFAANLAGLAVVMLDDTLPEELKQLRIVIADDSSGILNKKARS